MFTHRDRAGTCNAHAKGQVLELAWRSCVLQRTAYVLSNNARHYMRAFEQCQPLRVLDCSGALEQCQALYACSRTMPALKRSRFGLTALRAATYMHAHVLLNIAKLRLCAWLGQCLDSMEWTCLWSLRTYPNARAYQ